MINVLLGDGPMNLIVGLFSTGTFSSVLHLFHVCAGSIKSIDVWVSAGIFGIFLWKEIIFDIDRNLSDYNKKWRLPANELIKILPREWENNTLVV